MRPSESDIRAAISELRTLAASQRLSFDGAICAAIASDALAWTLGEGPMQLAGHTAPPFEDMIKELRAITSKSN